MTKLCYAFFKYENKLKIYWEKQRTVLKCTQMRARVEKVDVLGWNKSYVAYELNNNNFQTQQSHRIFQKYMYPVLENMDVLNICI